MSPVASTAVATLPELLDLAASGERGVRFLGADGAVSASLSYAALRAGALRVAGGLDAAGVPRGATVTLQLADPRQFLLGFWGCVLGGRVPAPVTPCRTADHLRKLEGVLRVLRAGEPWLIVEAEVGERLETLGSSLGEHPRTLSLEALTRADPGPACAPAPDDLALVQFSSGSTADPRGVELSHRNVVANLDGIARAAELGRGDLSLSWVPLTHDMGLIGFHLTPLYLGIDQLLLRPRDFLRRPTGWLHAASRLRATLLAAPSFALQLCLPRLKPRELEGLDLGCVRRVFVGADQVDPAACAAFGARLAPASLAPEAVYPVYGLAEATLGASFPLPGSPLRAVTVDPLSLVPGRRVRLAADGLRLVLLGAPIPGVELRLWAEGEVGPGVLGEVELRGPCVTRGYRGGDPRAGFTADGWLRTGDLGFLHEGQLVIAGRAKDVVCAGGETHHLHDLERLVREAGAGEAMLCVPSPHADDGLVAFVVQRGSLEGFARRARRVRGVLRRARGLRTRAVLPVQTLPRTTSGKLRRAPWAQRYLRGEFAELEASLPAAPAVTDTLSQVLALLAELCDEAPDPDRPFVDAGIESRALAEVALELERPGRELNAGVLLAAPTPRALARYLDTGELPAPARAPRAPASPGRALEPIAVVGLAARLPGSDGVQAFWEDLRAGADRTGPLPASRLADVRAALRLTQGPDAEPDCPNMGYLERIDRFAAAHFGIPSSEATLIHPAHRLLLELCAQALHDAGDGSRAYRGSPTGVYVAHVGDFEGVRYRELLERIAPELLGVATPGNLGSFAAGRVAHRLDLRGPALAVDAACSASLVAVHLACEALRRGECDQALVGSARVSVLPQRWPLRMGFESRSGVTRPFDAEADGCLLGEGGVVAVLKPLSLARRDGDRIYALVRGSAVTHDGGAGALTAPNPAAQAEALRRAWAVARVDPARLAFVEAHGAGTALGDPSELEALRQALGPVPREAPCWLGSVKGNVGHLFGASGLVGFLKAALALWQGELPPTVGHRRAHPALPFAEAQVRVATRPEPLGERALGGVTALGFSGTNAHVVLEAPPAGEAREGWRAPLALERERYWPDPRRAEGSPPSTLGGLAPSGPQARVFADETAALARVRAVLVRYAGVELAPGQEDVSLFALGLDSIVLLQLRQAVAGEAALSPASERLFQDVLTPRQLAQALLAASELPAAEARPAAEPAAAHAIPAPRLEPEALEPAQAAHVRELGEALAERVGGSKAWIDAHRDVLALNRAVAGLRPGRKELTVPLVARDARGCTLTLADGRTLIDLSMGFGVHLFGHSPDWLRAALARELEHGAPLGPLSPLAGDVARRIHELTGVERVAFFSTGTEAVSVALRLARTVTGKRTIVTFAGSYHGHHEQVLGLPGPGGAIPAARGIPAEALANTRILDYGDPGSLDAIWGMADDLAAVVVEPVQSRNPGNVPVEFLRELRALTRAAGVALVFDEVITGFRLHPGGAQARLGVEADLVVYGKVLGGGLPLGVVAGAARYLDAIDGGPWRYGDASLPQAPTTFVAGTYCQHPLSLAASRAVLERLAEEGPSLQKRLEARTADLCERLNQVFRRAGADLRAVHYASLFRIEGPGASELFFHELLREGVYVWEGRTCFLSPAHDDATLDAIVAAATVAARRVVEGGWFAQAPSRLPLTPAQRAVPWDPDDLDQRFLAAVRLEGPLDVEGLELAALALARRHPALRAIALDADGLQVGSRARVPWTRVHVRREAWVERAQALLGAPLPAPFWRLVCVRFAADDHALVLIAQRALLDGWSVGVLLEELAALYRALGNGAPARLATPPPLSAVLEGWPTRELSSSPSAPAPSAPAGWAWRSVPGGARRLRRLAEELGATPFAALCALLGPALEPLHGRGELEAGAVQAGQLLLGQPRAVGRLTLCAAVPLTSAGTLGQRAQRVLDALADPRRPATPWALVTVDRTPALDFDGLRASPLPTPALGCPTGLVLAALETPAGDLLLDLKHRASAAQAERLLRDLCAGLEEDRP